MSGEDHKYIQRAHHLATRGAGITFPNPMVGAVIVKDGAIVGEGYHRGAGESHAEVIAIREAGDKAAGSTLYLNLEPCCHYGKTPPCTDAIIEAGIRRVVFSIYDPDERVRGRGAGILRDSGVEVTAGLRAEEALQLNLAYVHRNITGRTFITLKVASTLNGHLTIRGRRWLTGIESRKRSHYFRNFSHAIAVGIGTMNKDMPRLDRRMGGMGLPPPLRIVLDSGLKFPPGYRWLKEGERVIIYCREDVDAKRVDLLAGAGAEVVKIPYGEGGLDLNSWRDDISERGIISVMVEGGGRLATSLLREGMLDRFIIFYAPLVSGRDQVSWFDREEKPGWVEEDGLIIRGLEKLEDDFCVIYDRAGIDSYLEMLTEGEPGVYRFDNCNSRSGVTE